MKLSPQVLDEMKQAYLQLKQQAHAYEQVLIANGVTLPSNGNGHAVQPKALPPPTQGFRAQVLQVIAEQPDITRRELIHKLEQSGLKVEGASSLGHRVSVELHALKTAKKLKLHEGKYRLA